MKASEIIRINPCFSTPRTSITPTLIICAWPHVRSNAWVDHLVRKVFAPLMIDLVRAKKVTKAHCFNNSSKNDAF